MATEGLIEVEKDGSELYMKIILQYNTTDREGIIGKKLSFNVYPVAIKQAIMEFLSKHNYLDRNMVIENYYIELDRNEDMMVAVIDQVQKR